MRSNLSGLLLLILAAPCALGERRAKPLRSYGRGAAVQDGWISASAVDVKTHMLQVVKGEPDTTAEPEELAAPAASPASPNDYIKSVSWSGTGCPKGPEEDKPSVTTSIDKESDFVAFFMEQFGVSMGLDGAYGPKEQSCSLVFDVDGVPAGWRFGFIDSRAEGNIYLEKGSIANFTTEIWWGDETAAMAQNMKYWPNFDRDDPVNVRYMTTPYMLDTLTMAQYASKCPAEGKTFSGKMTIKFTLGMMGAEKNVTPEPRALVDMLAVGITTKVIPC